MYYYNIYMHDLGSNRVNGNITSHFSYAGVVYDHACGALVYNLAREPRETEHILMLVDGAHWQGHSRVKAG